jgi:hypothetical protein
MTVLGHHSVGELRDWLSAIDYEAGQIASAYATFGPTWQAQDAAAHHEWAGQWKALQSRYGAAHARAQFAIARAQLDIGIPDSVIPVEDEWQAVLHALAKTPGAVARGDFQDLYNRLAAAQGKPIDMSKMPQPTATDADLSAYKAADTVIRAGESAARAVSPAQMSPGTKLLLGGGILLGLLIATKVVLR